MSKTKSQKSTSKKPVSKKTSTKVSAPKRKLRPADQYDNGSYNYQHYWDGRDYEHAAEQLMIEQMLSGRKFKHAVDVGGGYGRLSVLLCKYAKKVTLIDPSKKQLQIAKDFLKDYPQVDAQIGQAEKLPFKDGSVDLAMVVRVIHHLPNPIPMFEEIHRILPSGGLFLIEFANYANFKNRVKHILKAKKMPTQPVDISTSKDNDISFVNHNPKVVKRQLMQLGFKVEDQLSVSNFRSPTLKKRLPKKMLIKLEKALQRPLAKTYFGPSTVFLLKKR